MPVTAISLSTGCLAGGGLITPAAVSAAVSVSAEVFVTSGASAGRGVGVSWECASCGPKRQKAARKKPQLRRKLPAKRPLLLHPAITDSQTRSLGKRLTRSVEIDRKARIC